MKRIRLEVGYFFIKLEIRIAIFLCQWCIGTNHKNYIKDRIDFHQYLNIFKDLHQNLDNLVETESQEFDFYMEDLKNLKL